MAREHLNKSKSYTMDSDGGNYRSSTELSVIQNAVEMKAEEMATDLVDELEAKGIVSPKDYEGKQEVIGKTVEDYQGKFMRWLQSQ